MVYLLKMVIFYDFLFVDYLPLPGFLVAEAPELFRGHGKLTTSSDVWGSERFKAQAIFPMLG